MQPEKKNIFSSVANNVLFVVFFVLFQLIQWSIIANLSEYTVYVCSPNNTSTSQYKESDCPYYITVLSGSLVLLVSTSIFLCYARVIWSLISGKIRKFQQEAYELDAQLTELEIQLMEINIRNRMNSRRIRRLDNDRLPNTELPNEREHLLTEVQRPNYHATETAAVIA